MRNRGKAKGVFAGISLGKSPSSRHTASDSPPETNPMNRLAVLLAAVAAVAAAVALSKSSVVSTATNADANPFGLSVAEKNPWTSLTPNADPNQFQFVVVSDRTGGHRDKIFSRAVQQINLMQPEFVVSVGDLIEGYSTDDEKLKAQWAEFDGYVKKLEMPFFYVPGNHDIGNREELAMWGGRYGKSYYSFVYKNVLFLCLNSEDGPQGNKMSPEQVEFVKKELETKRDVQWTMIFLHKPIWTAADQEKAGWAECERALAGRKYTVFCGHVHRYQKFVRNGMNYYQLATTGGGSKLRGVPYGEFDQIAWITMKPDGPRIANILLDGLLPENLTVPESDEMGVSQKKLATVAASATVTFQGKPLANAIVTLTMIKPPEGYRSVAADGLTDEQGRVTFTAYSKFDGAPVGEYKLTVAMSTRRPSGEIVDESKLPKIPAKFTKAATTPLTVTVKGGTNEFAVEVSE
jgi:predicted phosphodiesterase